MSTCPSCGLNLGGDTAICPHHAYANGDDFAVNNRAMCDGIHRGEWPKRLPSSERDEMADSFWTPPPPIEPDYSAA